MVFPIIGDFNEKNFDEEIYPPYRNLARDVNISEYGAIKSKFEMLRRLVRETYNQLNILEHYTSYDGRYEEYTRSTYNILTEIYELSERMDELIGDIIIEAKESSYNKIETFEWYLKRVQYEIIEPIIEDAFTIRDHITKGYVPSIEFLTELDKFVRSARKALREVNKMIDEALQRM